MSNENAAHNHGETSHDSSSQPLLAIRGLTLDIRTPKGDSRILEDISLEVRPGEILGVVGESGSGKSMTALSVMRILPTTATITSGTIEFDGVDLASLSSGKMRKIRGRRMAMVFQDHMTTLDPVASIGAQIEEAYRIHHPRASRAEARARMVETLTQVGVLDAAERAKEYPHQWSGGMRQRAVIAMALVNDPDLIIADEPTTALDVTIQAEILTLLRKLRDDRGLSILLITHDMGVIADMADRIVVMKDGEIVETAEVHALFEDPKHAYTRKLLDAVPRPLHDEAVESAPPLDEPNALEVQSLIVEYGRGPFRSGFRAVNHVSFTVPAGKVVGLVGESGSGKSTIGKAVVGLAPITSGVIRVGGRELRMLRGRAARAARATYGMVFQDPASSLNPRMSIAECIAEPLIAHRGQLGAKARRARVRELMEHVELPTAWTARFPHELSGGQRQRVGIARALALEPDLLIADEPTSALDVSVQAAVLELFQDLQQRLGFSCLFISHDLAVVELLSESVVVLQRGQIVEQGDARSVLNDPQTDYARRLVDAAPLPDPTLQRARHTSTITTV
ncbi:dipeptide ABC transporter ATP-binding protein [Parenemella sanctibonifatiensis]|uniref:Glutathione ABC transporter ATP-binding protein n=1 Tax=Parenemella sanctibonifatiensis TaxID=2016505 RepID=A0A255EAB7_9ACTN|nr:ABC transporter ATP-binding protein [Parenemella sanctibonifatiensis]OYN88220.1 glutathione ABC transporter ATP-binding protein [Parenemella sanctibonifatiensis]